MHRAIVNVGVVFGQSVNAGSTLLSLGTMKMETHVAADRREGFGAVVVHPDRCALMALDSRHDLKHHG